MTNVKEWIQTKLYDENGVQVYIVRAKDNSKLKAWKIVENGVERTVTHAEAAVYIDPDYNKRIERQRAQRANRAKNKLTRSEWEYNYLPTI